MPFMDNKEILNLRIISRICRSKMCRKDKYFAVDRVIECAKKYSLHKSDTKDGDAFVMDSDGAGFFPQKEINKDSDFWINFQRSF